jgi:(p)ppGpp synthase/HD superfamily hydrolase
MLGAKVNTKMVSFDTTLRNGDIVEIITRDSAHPTTKWLEMAKTSMARKHIRLALDVPKRGGPVISKADSRLLRKKNGKKKSRP